MFNLKFSKIMKNAHKPGILHRQNAKKIFQPMKIPFLLIMISVLNVHATGIFSQNAKISVHMQDVTVREVVSSAPNQADMKYEEIKDNFVVLLSKNENTLQQNTQQNIVTGTVTDNFGVPLPGASVVVRGTTVGTVTDSDGFYSISNVPPNATLVYSFVGTRSVEVLVGTQTVIDVTLVEDAIGLEEVVAIGYGFARRRDLIGSVSSVRGEQFENVPASRVDQLLQGRASGVQVTQISGAPGTGSSIRIRGGNSIQANNEPLYVIDGYIVGTDFNLNNINVNDIESIDILKDATSVSIYGTRGANGVILITTKSGRHLSPGRPVFSVNSYTGIQELTSRIDLASGPELAYLSNLDAQNRGAALPFPDMNNVPDTDWISQITEVAPMTNMDFSIAGQTVDQSMNYYLSGNYFTQNGIVRNSGIDRYNFRSNLDYRLNDRLSMGVRLNISNSRVENAKVAIASVIGFSLTAQAIYNEDGSFTGRNPVTGANTRNPEADIQLRTDHNILTNILGSAYIQYEPFNNLVFRSTIGPQINSFKNNFYLPGMLPERLAVHAGGYGRINSSLGTDILNENTVSYRSSLNGNHNFDLLGGFTWQTFGEESFEAHGYGFTNDVVRFNNLGLGDPARNEVSSGYNGFQLVSWLGRLNYNLNEKYYLTLVGRVDGSSRFFRFK
jgi:TonB-dependent starch-binding outer membrane protein SusC